MGADPALVASQSSQSSLSRPKASIRARVRSSIRRHPALILFAALATPIVILDLALDFHALAMVLALYLGLSFADAWDEDTAKLAPIEARRVETPKDGSMRSTKAGNSSKTNSGSSVTVRGE